MKYCLFLTASIDPKNTPQVGRNSIKMRESDYFDALSRFAELGYAIVFCENSGYHSEMIIQLCQQKGMEYLSFISKDSYKGKGHGEKEIFDFGLLNSKLLSEADYIVKITGRLYVKNISKILNLLTGSDFHISCNFTRNLTWSDSRLIIFKKSFYENYFKLALEQYLNEPKGIVFERCLARATHRAISEGLIWTPLPYYPYYCGYNALNNKLYQKNIFSRLKYRVYYIIKLFVLNQTI